MTYFTKRNGLSVFMRIHLVVVESSMKTTKHSLVCSICTIKPLAHRPITKALSWILIGEAHGGNALVII